MAPARGFIRGPLDHYPIDSGKNNLPPSVPRRARRASGRNGSLLLAKTLRRAYAGFPMQFCRSERIRNREIPPEAGIHQCPLETIAKEHLRRPTLSCEGLRCADERCSPPHTNRRGGAASRAVATARRRPRKAWPAAQRAARAMKSLRWGSSRSIRVRSCRRARTTKPRGRKRTTEQRRQGRPNAFEHFDVGCETSGGLRRRNNESKNFEPAR